MKVETLEKKKKKEKGKKEIVQRSKIERACLMFIMLERWRKKVIKTIILQHFFIPSQLPLAFDNSFHISRPKALIFCILLSKVESFSVAKVTQTG